MLLMVKIKKLSNPTKIFCLSQTQNGGVNFEVKEELK